MSSINPVMQLSDIEPVDILILTAVKDERDVLLQLEQDWVEGTDASGYLCHFRQDPNGLRWALARSADMGPEFAANLATRLIPSLKPRVLAMVGVCAGWRDKVVVGDVIVAERLFRYDAGKLKAFRKGQERREEVFHDIRTYNLKPHWRQRAEDFPPTWVDAIHTNTRPIGYRDQEVWLLEALDEMANHSGQRPQERSERSKKCPDWSDVVSRLEKRSLISLSGGIKITDAGLQHLRELHDRYPDGQPKERDIPKAHVAPMATGNRVMEDDELFPTIHKYERKTLGVEMEGAAVAAVADIEGVEHCLVVKGVQDHADLDKDDRFRHYSIEASYRFLVAFLKEQIVKTGVGLARTGSDIKSESLKIDLTHLPAGTEHFLGRLTELSELDAALASTGRIAIVELIAPGGVGKTSLVKRWLDGVRTDGWRGTTRIYGWSFYSQGTRDDKQASEDHFLADALTWFGVDIDQSANPWDKGRELAKAIVASRTLLVLDGIEPLQYPPGPLTGVLHAPGTKALLQHLASAGHSGLCLITSRVRLEDLNQYERNASRPEGTVQRVNLGNLDDADGARLLHALGVNKAGAAAIGLEDEELRTASGEIHGHALALSLLGRYLALAYDGDIRKRDQVNFQAADAETAGGHAFKIMAAYEIWFASTGKRGESILATLRLFGFFDRPASTKSLRALRVAPAIPGLTRPLVNLDPKDWRAALKRLEQCGLIFPIKDGDAYDAHPLVREYMAQILRQRQPAAWREGHRRLYEQLKSSVPYHPEGLTNLQPLYQAVSHGCQAGLLQKTCDEVYQERILRGKEAYSIRKLGAFGADLGAASCFFAEPWHRLAPGLNMTSQAWMLHEAAFRLRGIGRLKDALEPMRASCEMDEKLEEWEGASASYGALSELQLSLGQVKMAVADAKLSVAHADRCDEWMQRVICRATLADALHQHGEEAAMPLFAEAEALQAKEQSQYLLLYSMQGYRYCDLLLTHVEQAAWKTMELHPVDQSEAKTSSHTRLLDYTTQSMLLRDCTSVMQRAAQTLIWSKENEAGLLDYALGHLVLARCALYTTLLQGQPQVANNYANTQLKIDAAVAGLFAAGAQHHIPRGLLVRAWLYHCQGNESGANSDLDEAERIARRGDMRLHLADIQLTRGRLFSDCNALRQARALIEQCEYFRRLPELEDAEKAIS